MLGKFLELMVATPAPLLGLLPSSRNLLDLVPCEGAAILEGDKAHMLGNTPGYVDLVKIAEMLHVRNLPSTFLTDCLKNHSWLTTTMEATASGVIALSSTGRTAGAPPIRLLERIGRSSPERHRWGLTFLRRHAAKELRRGLLLPKIS